MPTAQSLWIRYSCGSRVRYGGTDRRYSPDAESPTQPNPPKEVTPVPRIAVAMSGGVDSSVAAALVLEAGRDVLGVTMRLGLAELADRACCG